MSWARIMAPLSGGEGDKATIAAAGFEELDAFGALSLHEGRLYIPLAAQEELASRQSSYECCTFRGNLVALDAGRLASERQRRIEMDVTVRHAALHETSRCR